MKFGKTMENEIRNNQMQMPVYPYKKMKKIIKYDKNSKIILEKMMHTEITKLDEQWNYKSNILLIKHKYVPFLSSESLQKKAKKMLTCGQLYTEATRKILKKYNKQRGNIYGYIKNDFNFKFQQSKTISKLKVMSNMLVHLDCIVCFDKLIFPYVKECGHFICCECYKKLKHESCPVCRNETKWFKIDHSKNLTKQNCIRLQEYWSKKNDHNSAMIKIMQNIYK